MGTPRSGDTWKEQQGHGEIHTVINPCELLIAASYDQLVIGSRSAQPCLLDDTFPRDRVVIIEFYSTSYGSPYRVILAGQSPLADRPHET